MSNAFPVVKGIRLRATKINSCGMPVAGPANRLVTTGFVSVNITKVNKDAQDLEQQNAEGLICVTDRTPPERKYFTPAVELCNVDPELISLFNGWQQVLDYANNPIGFRDDPMVDINYGVALEVWTGGRSDDDCPTPTTDSIFSSGGSGLKYGYFLLGGVEWELGNIDIRAQVATFTLTGRTIAMPHWGKGPYNVAGTDSSGTPGRLLVPVGQEEHFTVFRTPVPPPDPTGGAVPLATSSIFTSPNYYYGGPSNAPAATVAPAQAPIESFTVTVTGTPTGGTFTLLVTDGQGVMNQTAAIQWNAASTDVAAAIAAVLNPDIYTSVDVATTGGPLPTTAVVVNFDFEEPNLAVGTVALTGGTSPTVTVTGG